jgi:hypothetical protein
LFSSRKSSKVFTWLGHVSHSDTFPPLPLKLFPRPFFFRLLRSACTREHSPIRNTHARMYAFFLSIQAQRCIREDPLTVRQTRSLTFVWRSEHTNLLFPVHRSAANERWRTGFVVTLVHFNTITRAGERETAFRRKRTKPRTPRAFAIQCPPC